MAIVTGAAQGLGAAIAKRLAEAQAQVVLCDTQLEAATSTAESINRAVDQDLAIAMRVDVTDEQQVEALVDDTVKRFGSVSILVNNAGILFPTRIGEITHDEWQRVIAVNLTGSFLFAKAVIPSMREAGFGRIVNMSSSAGRSVSTIGGAHYTAAKAGVLGLTRALAKELAADGILVNAICPGLIDTEMVRSTCDAQRIKAYADSFPIGRLGRAEEIAEAVWFLCSNGTYVTGASIDVNGGDLMM